jgi:hypothetical protein
MNPTLFGEDQYSIAESLNFCSQMEHRLSASALNDRVVEFVPGDSRYSVRMQKGSIHVRS